MYDTAFTTSDVIFFYTSYSIWTWDCCEYISLHIWIKKWYKCERLSCLYSWLLWRTTGPQFNQTHLMMKKRKNSITNFLYERRDVRFCMFCLDNCNIIVVLIGFYWNMSVFFYYWHSFLSTGMFFWMKLPVPPTTFSHSTGKQLFISPVASIQWLHHRRVPEKQTAQYELFVHLINCTRGKFYWLIITYYNINMVG